MLNRLVIAAFVLLLAPPAAPVAVRLGTLVPANTTWDKALRDMGNTWNKDTAGRVTLTVFAGGSQGDEATTIKKLQNDVLQASFLTSVGLADLDDAFNVFGMPFFIETPEEVAAIEKKLTPILEQRLQAKGLHLLAWGTGGWVQVFSKKPLKTLADVKAAKLFTSKGSDRWVRYRCCPPTFRRS
jgi:TRAP-type C4-dicarboxylate transport system substrate-binding protein